MAMTEMNYPNSGGSGEAKYINAVMSTTTNKELCEINNNSVGYLYFESTGGNYGTFLLQNLTITKVTGTASGMFIAENGKLYAKGTTGTVTNYGLVCTASSVTEVN